MPANLRQRGVGRRTVAADKKSKTLQNVSLFIRAY